MEIDPGNKEQNEYTSIQVSLPVKLHMDEKALEMRKILKRSKRVSYDRVLRWIFGLDKEDKT